MPPDPTISKTLPDAVKDQIGIEIEQAIQRHGSIHISQQVTPLLVATQEELLEIAGEITTVQRTLEADTDEAHALSRVQTRLSSMSERLNMLKSEVGR